MASRGGVQSYMWRLWEMLAAIHETHDSQVTGLSLMDTPGALAAWANAAPFRPTGASGRKLGFMRRAFCERKGVDCVVVGHLHLAPVAWLAKLLRRINRYVVVLHGVEAWERGTWAQRMGLRYADAVVATTRYTAQTCAAVNQLTMQNFQVIPLCAEPAPTMPDPNFALDGDCPILFVGRLATNEKYKGLETLMGAISRISANVPCKLHVIGDGDDRARLQALARTLGLSEDNVQFYGRVSDAVLQAAYLSAKVFAMPSAREGFGIVFLEAMRRAVPCIGGAHGGTPEVFRDGTEGFQVNYEDVATLSQRLQTLITDEKLHLRFAIAGQQRFGLEYTFTPFLQRWSALIYTHH
ncbi:MAG: glycosyltransferase family 4 protein [Aeromicrobium sp.]|nr:glycosyltransferase family 4 protein [Burkholderiales bacterium]